MDNYVNNLINKKNKYYVLLDRIVDIKKYIDNTIGKIEDSIELYKKSFTIDGVIADKNILSNTKSNLKCISDNLANDITLINNKINGIGNDIDNYYEDVAVLEISASLNNSGGN